MINKKNSTVSILLALLIISFFVFQLPKLTFDYELENFFPLSDPDLSYYQEFSKTFGYDNDYLLLGFESKTGVFDSQFLGKIDGSIRQISEMTGTIKVISPTSLKSLVKTPLGLLPIPVLHLSDPKNLKQDSVKLYNHPLYREMFLSKSGQTLKVIIIHDRFATKEAADKYVGGIQTILADHKSRPFLAGKAIAQTAFVNAVKDDFTKFILMALVLIFLSLLVFMRNIFMIITSLSVVGFSVATTIGLMALSDKKIDVLSSLIPTILLVVSMSDIVHLFSHIQKKYEETHQLKIAVGHAIRHIGAATLLTSFTTAIGFLTLITIHVKPIIDLGIYSAIGIGFALLITYLLFPAIVVLTQPNFSRPSVRRPLEHILQRVYTVVMQKGKVIGLCSILLLVLCLGGVWRMEIDAYLVDDLPKNDPVKTDFLFFDQQFSGSKPFTLSLWLKDTTAKIYSQEVLIEIDKAEELIRKHTHAGDLISPVSYIKMANQSLHKGSVDYFRLPESEKDWRQALKWVERTHPDRLFIKVSEQSQAQMSGYFQDLGSKDATLKYKSLLTALAQEIDHEIIDYRVTGTTLLVDKSHELLSINLIKGLLLAMLIVAVLAGGLFRSWRMIIITLIPNILPILVVAATMGYFKIPLNLSTSVIFAISFGIVVDDTIHFLSQFKFEYATQKNKDQAIKNTILKTGEPILLTTILLTAGFLVFCFSSFSATFYMGLFVCISFITAVFADLFLLPLLLRWWLPNTKES